MRLVTQPALAVEAHRWQGARASVTVVVKAAFALEAPALARPEPRPLVEGDRVPWKASPEVIVVGSARAPSPQRRIAVRVGLDGWSKRCEAIADTATTTIPLLGDLRDESGAPATLGPIRPSAPAPDVFDPGMDFGQLNVAGDDQRVPSIEAEATLTLQGLVGTGDPFETTLPTWRPSAAGRTTQGELFGLPLRCDTLWLDVDAREVVMLWRALWMLEPRAAPSAIFVAAGVVALTADEVITRVESMQPPSAPTAPGRGTVVLEDGPSSDADVTTELPPSISDTPTTDAHSASPETLVHGRDIAEESTVPDTASGAATLDGGPTLPAHLRELLDAVDHDGARTIDVHGMETLNVSEGREEVPTRPVRVAVESAGFPTPADDDAWVRTSQALELYATVQNALDEGAGVEVLPHFGLDGARWHALRVHWIQRAQADPDVARELDRLLAGHGA